MLHIDGSLGEGGGQILRSSLALSMVTGQPFKITKIRCKRKKGGLLRQHLTAVNAAVQVCSADVSGNSIGSKELVFRPGTVKPGPYRFAVSTAGSATLVFQTVFPALMTASAESELELAGGTHNPFAPPYDFLDKVFAPLVKQLGVEVSTEIERYGFYPAGGGKFSVEIKPAKELEKIEILECGKRKRVHVRGIVGKIPEHIAEKEVKLVADAFDWSYTDTTSESVPSPGPGNALMAENVHENITELFTGFGEKNLPLSKVAHSVISQIQRYLKADAPVGRYLADQLLIPMAMAGYGKYRTLTPSQHTLTNIEIVKIFMGSKISCEDEGKDRCLVTVGE